MPWKITVKVAAIAVDDFYSVSATSSNSLLLLSAISFGEPLGYSCCI